MRQVDGPYLVGVTSHDQSTVFATLFQLGVRVTEMFEVPTATELPERKTVRPGAQPLFDLPRTGSWIPYPT